jgi:hypothetical protein
MVWFSGHGSNTGPFICRTSLRKIICSISFFNKYYSVTLGRFWIQEWLSDSPFVRPQLRSTRLLAAGCSTGMKTHYHVHSTLDVEFLSNTCTYSKHPKPNRVQLSNSILCQSRSFNSRTIQNPDIKVQVSNG